MASTESFDKCNGSQKIERVAGTLAVSQGHRIQAPFAKEVVQTSVLINKGADTILQRLKLLKNIKTYGL